MTVYLWGFALVFAAILVVSIVADDMDTDRPFWAFLLAIIWPFALAILVAAIIHKLAKSAR